MENYTPAYLKEDVEIINGKLTPIAKLKDIKTINRIQSYLKPKLK